MTSSPTRENIKSHPPDGVSHLEMVCILGKGTCSHGKSGKDFEGQAKGHAQVLISLYRNPKKLQPSTGSLEC